MSDTFQRVFDNAAEVALLERASIIVSIEDRLPEKRKTNFLRYASFGTRSGSSSEFWKW